MALTLTQLAAAMRLGDGVTAPVEPDATILARLLGASQALVDKLCPEAPDVVADEALVRVCSYLYDRDPSESTRFTHALEASGAMSLLRPFCPNIGILVGTSAAELAAAGLSRKGVLALILEWAQAGNDDPIPAAKLVNAPVGSGLNAGQVEDFAKTGLPHAKVPAGRLASGATPGEVLRVTTGGALHWGFHGRFRGAFETPPTQAVSSPVVGDWAVQLDGNDLVFWERIGDEGAANWNLRRRYSPPDASGVTIGQVNAAIATHAAVDDAHQAVSEAWANVGDATLVPGSKIPGQRLTLATLATYNTSNHVVSVTVEHALRSGDVIYFQMPSTISQDHSGTVSLRWRVEEAGSYSAALSLNDIDGAAHNPGDFVASRLYTAIRFGNTFRLIEPLFATLGELAPTIQTQVAGMVARGQGLESAGTGDQRELSLDNEGAQDLVAAMFVGNSGVSYDDAAGTITLPDAGDGAENYAVLRKTGSKIGLWRIARRTSSGAMKFNLGGWLTTGNAWSVSSTDILDLSSALNHDDFFFAKAADAVDDYDELSDKPIHRITSHNLLPEADADTDGLVYQTLDLGQRFVGEEVIEEAGNRVLTLVECLTFSSGVAGQHLYRGAVADRSGLPDPPVAADRGSIWLRQDLLDRHVAPFVEVDSNLDFVSVQTPPAGTKFWDGLTERILAAYKGVFHSRAAAEASTRFTGAYQVCVFPDPVGGYQLFYVDDDFAAGTTTETVHRFRDTAVTDHLLARIAALENPPAAGLPGLPSDGLVDRVDFGTNSTPPGITTNVNSSRMYYLIDGASNPKTRIRIPDGAKWLLWARTENTGAFGMVPVSLLPEKTFQSNPSDNPDAMGIASEALWLAKTAAGDLLGSGNIASSTGHVNMSIWFL